MMKLNAKQTEAMSTVYAELNAAEWLAFAKPLKGVWYWYTVPMTAQNVAGLISDGEETENDGLKIRFRPSNAAFYRIAARNGVQPVPLASVQTVDALVASISAQYGRAANRGTAVESLIAAAVGAANWEWRTREVGWWQQPDVIASDGRRIQCKAYGGNILEVTLHKALADKR